MTQGVKALATQPDDVFDLHMLRMREPTLCPLTSTCNMHAMQMHICTWTDR